MKKTFRVTRLAFPGALAAAMLFTGCAAQQHPQRYGTAPAPAYETAEQIKVMPPCRAKVVHRSPCFVYLKTVEGKGLYLGGPGSKSDVDRFLAGLKIGQSYDLPDAFLKYHPTTLP